MASDWASENKGRTTNVVKLLESFKSIEIFKLFSMKKHPYDNIISIFNFSLLSKILLIEALLLTCKDIFGAEISCTFNTVPKLSNENINDYCWIDGSYTTLPNSHSSISPYVGVTSSVQTDDGSKFYHRYYQWVYFALLLQSVMFFSLKWIWDRLLDQRVIDLVGKLKSDKKNLYEYKKADQMNLVQSVADLLFSNVTFYYNVILMEIICLVHLIFQIWATDRFLNGNFLKLGVIWLDSSYSMKSITSLFLSSPSTSPSNPEFRSTVGDSSYSNSYDPLQLIFPRMVKCTLQFFGLTGDINSYDGLCFLAANSLHEKVYLCQWFLYHFMFIFIILILFYRGLTLTLPPLRYFMLSYTSSSFAAKSYRRLLNSPGNWFLLNILSTTVPISHFIDLMNAVVELHFDKHGKPLHNSAFGKYAKANEGIKVDRSFKTSKSVGGAKVEEDIEWSSDWDKINLYAPKALTPPEDPESQESPEAPEAPEKSSDETKPSVSNAV
ncbi:innexin shaking-B-like [Panonychus citri]|uniref:innexin shaking-B-like n=1 Tax=Panonychus citri TaxID=50023 RepID=UPI0023073C36|nr:innexin shaking-B-like [Panonychus citri]